jgi:hypothetical protein
LRFLIGPENIKSTRRQQKSSRAILLESLSDVRQTSVCPQFQERQAEACRTYYGVGVGDGRGSGSRFKVGGAGLVLSGVVVESSGVGCLRFKVGRPGVPSSDPPIAPFDEARAFDNLSMRFLTL